MVRTAVGGVLLVVMVLAGTGCKQVVKPDKRTELAPDVRLATMPVPAGTPRVVLGSPDGARQALIVATPEAADREPLHVFLKAGGRDFVLVGLPYEGKGIENLRWQDARTLVFDRWFSEEQGIRFFIDVHRGVLGHADPIRR